MRHNSKCKTCGRFVSAARFEESDICIKCSTVEPYLANVVYPHKTGAYVEPVTKEQKEHIQRIDRRSVKTSKMARSYSSWDRWLKNYIIKRDAPQTPKRVVYRPMSVNHIHISYPKAWRIALNSMDQYGYEKARKSVDELFINSRIALSTKTKLNNNLAKIQLMNAKDRRKYLKSIIKGNK